MKAIFISMVSLISTLSLMAQSPIELKVWPDGAPNSNGITVTEETGTTERPQNITEATLAVYPAEQPNGMAIIACPGGGYHHLSMKNEGHDMAAWFNSQGITYAVLRYRMPNGHSDVPLSDAQEAMRIMKAHAEEWKIDTDKIGIMGASAGGHLAATAATHYTKDTRPAFQILLYPVITMDTEVTHMGSRTNLLGENPTEAEVKEFSNELHVTAETPSAFIALAGDDKSVPPANSLRYYEALIGHKVQVSMHIYPIGGHGFGFKDTFIYKRQWTEELKKWLSVINK